MVFWRGQLTGHVRAGGSIGETNSYVWTGRGPLPFHTCTYCGHSVQLIYSYNYGVDIS